jgi:hypothetical protein
LEIARRVLHGDDVGLLRDPEHRLVLDPCARAARDVVHDDRELGGVGDVLEMGHEAALRRLVVVRRDDDDPVGAGLLGGLGQLEGLGGRIRPGAADQLALAPDRVTDRAEQVGLLLVGKGRRLAGRAHDEDRVGAVVREPGSELLRAVEVDTVIGPERRDHRGDDRSESSGHAMPPLASPGGTRDPWDRRGPK